jgi:hypothetical protein
MLTAGYISAVFGMEMPGPGAIYVSQTLNFRAPVRQGDRVVAKVRVMELYPAKRRARFECTCSVGDKVVLEGEAVLMVPRVPLLRPRSRSLRCSSPGSIYRLAPAQDDGWIPGTSPGMTAINSRPSSARR